MKIIFVKNKNEKEKTIENNFVKNKMILKKQNKKIIFVKNKKTHFVIFEKLRKKLLNFFSEFRIFEKVVKKINLFCRM